MSDSARSHARTVVTGLALSLALAAGHPAPATAAATAPPSVTSPAGITAGADISASNASGKSMSTVIKQAKKKNKAAFAKRLKTLKKSAALISVINQANRDRKTLYLEFFAAVTTQKKADKLVTATKGRHFVVSGSDSRPRVLLVSNAATGSMGVRSALTDSVTSCNVVQTGITCWQGWVAFWAWWAGSEMTCVAFGAAVGAGMSPTGPMAVAGGVIAASACSGLMAYLQAQFIDFELICRKAPSPESVGGANRLSVAARRTEVG